MDPNKRGSLHLSLQEADPADEHSLPQGKWSLAHLMFRLISRRSVSGRLAPQHRSDPLFRNIPRQMPHEESSVTFPLRTIVEEGRQLRVGAPGTIGRFTHDVHPLYAFSAHS